MAGNSSGIRRVVDAPRARGENLAHCAAAAGCYGDATLRVDRHGTSILGARRRTCPRAPSFTRRSPEGGALAILEFAFAQAHFYRPPRRALLYSGGTRYEHRYYHNRTT